MEQTHPLPFERPRTGRVLTGATTAILTTLMLAAIAAISFLKGPFA